MRQQAIRNRGRDALRPGRRVHQVRSAQHMPRFPEQTEPRPVRRGRKLRRLGRLRAVRICSRSRRDRGAVTAAPFLQLLEQTRQATGDFGDIPASTAERPRDPAFFDRRGRLLIAGNNAADQMPLRPRQLTYDEITVGSS